MPESVRVDQDLLQQLLEEESTITNEHSPGLVEDNEILLRTGFSPESINARGEVQKNAIPAKDLIARGLSCDRKSHADPAAIRARMAQQAANESTREQRVNSFIFELPCEMVRYEIKDDFDSRMNVVLDTAMAENKAHSSIKAALNNEAAARKIRSKFYPFVKNHQPLEQYLQSSFSENSASSQS